MKCVNCEQELEQLIDGEEWVAPDGAIFCSVTDEIHNRVQVMNLDKCRFCGLRGLVLFMANADYSCEHCGKWQDAILGSAWEITGYEQKGASK